MKSNLTPLSLVLVFLPQHRLAFVEQEDAGPVGIEQSIERALQALSQVADRLEVIVVDDKSPDDTYARGAALTTGYAGLPVIRRRKARDMA